MKKQAIGVVIGTLFAAAPAMAADLPPRVAVARPAPVVVESSYNWTGFYIGINGGAAKAEKCWTFVGTAAGAVPPVSEGCHEETGATVGGQIGYMWQMGSFVFGLDAQGNWADIEATGVSTAFPAFRNRSRVDAFGIFTGRIGFAANNFLFYVKGGGAVVSDRFDYFTNPGGTLVGDAGKQTEWGWAAGGGLEVAFWSNWSLGFDYTFMKFEHRNVAFVSPASTRDDIEQEMHVFTARLNYRWGGGPVVARY